MLFSLHSLKSQTFYVLIKFACKELNAKRPLERVAVHAIPITVGGQTEGAIGLLAAAATTENTACVAGDLVAGDGDVHKLTLLYRVVVGIEGGDGEFRQHVLLGATYIVSNDRHFDELKRYDFPKVDVRKLSEFLNIVRTL